MVGRRAGKRIEQKYSGVLGEKKKNYRVFHPIPPSNENRIQVRFEKRIIYSMTNVSFFKINLWFVHVIWIRHRFIVHEPPRHNHSILPQLMYAQYDVNFKKQKQEGPNEFFKKGRLDF